MIRKVAITLAVASSAVLASPATLERRIVGGEDAKVGEFPFIVSVHFKNDKSAVCGGSLLDSTTVVTAGHCVTGAYSVKAGTLDLEMGGVDAKVASGIIHPNYTADSHGNSPLNDIGILKLSTPIEKSETIGYATLPPSGSDPVVNSIATAAGWGTQLAPFIVLMGSSADKLSKVVVPIRAREYCSNLNPRAGTDIIICAGGDGKNVCIGDSGGPLVDKETGQLIGLASWVIRDSGHYACNQAPSVYTRVSSYMPFINEYLGRSAPQNPEQCNEVRTQTFTECRKRNSDDFDGCVQEGQDAFVKCSALQ